jgi:membrane fusion protein, copper/silver efflux system
MRKVFYVVSLVLAVSLGFLLGRSRKQPERAPGTARRILYYVDPMHPAYRSEKPGIAPDCGMQLEPVYADEAAKMVVANVPVSDAGKIDSPTKQLFGIRVAKVENTTGSRTVRVLGRVTADETRSYRVNASLDGFVEETHNDTVGTRVKKGQHLAVVYSLEFFSMIGGYISASEQAQASTQSTGSIDPRKSLEVTAWADRLRNLGMSESQIEELYETHKVPKGVYVVSPADGYILARNISPGMRFERNMEFYRIADLNHVWIVADLFGGQDRLFRPNSVARIKLQNQNRSVSARVSDVLPQVDPVTRAVRLRLEADNQSLILRPDMFVNVDLALPAPGGLSVPADAVIDAGLSTRVYVDRGNGTYEPRAVRTGERFGDRVQILSGLKEGETVVASGTFLVDSESRLKSNEDTSSANAEGHTRSVPRAALRGNLSQQARVFQETSQGQKSSSAP